MMRPYQQAFAQVVAACECGPKNNGNRARKQTDQNSAGKQSPALISHLQVVLHLGLRFFFGDLGGNFGGGLC